jgi:dihydroxyacetone kinase
VVVTDDIASAPAERIDERRGAAGDVTVFKIAGAATRLG